jgi:L-threonylcarbamoyladenylate synthase
VWVADPTATEAKITEQITEAAKLLQSNEVVGFPTETVYGLGGSAHRFAMSLALLTNGAFFAADAWSDAAIEKIYRAKGRPSDNPLIVHVASSEQFHELVEFVPDIAQQLVKAFWPGSRWHLRAAHASCCTGPLTIILKKKGPISTRVTAGLSTVAVRMPSHPVALAIIKQVLLLLRTVLV